MDADTVDRILEMLDLVIAEYHNEREAAGPLDPYTEHRTRTQLATAERIKTEIIVMSGRLPEGATF